MRYILWLLISMINGLYGSVPSNCTEKYGDHPAKETFSPNSILAILNLCANISGHVETLSFIDSNGNQRYGCLLIVPSSQPLPLLVWLHPSQFPASVIIFTDLISEAYTANLTGTANGPLGYHLLLPFGRNTTHIYPLLASSGLGWDNWYRNYNRSDPALNVDVQTIDNLIDQVLHKQTSTFRIDESRLFMSGWSNGAAMAVEYALNTPNITAAAVYSAPDPYRDYQDPCAQIPYPTQFTPVLILYNQCDIIGICETGTAFIDDLNTRYPTQLTAQAIIINDFLQTTMTCNPLCNAATNLGAVQHGRWPIPLNDEVFFNFFRQHQLLSR